MSRGSVAIVGHQGLTHLGESFRNAALADRRGVRLYDMAEAERAPRLVRSAAWRLLGHRPPRLGSFASHVVQGIERDRPDCLIATGQAPLTAAALRRIGAAGVRRVNVSTDDPWNPTARARWFLDALPEYDTVWTPRDANVNDFRRAGVRDVRRLMFGYDPAYCHGPDLTAATRAHLACDVLFVGGADADRQPLMAALVAAGLSVALYGDYWDRHAVPEADWRGHVDAEIIRQATLAARVVLILVRRANRDGHTMRSVEAGAIGACLLVEDTPDHRALYGTAAAFFDSPETMLQQARALVADAELREAMVEAVRERIRSGGHTYVDRLRTILEAA